MKFSKLLLLIPFFVLITVFFSCGDESVLSLFRPDGDAGLPTAVILNPTNTQFLVVNSFTVAGTAYDPGGGLSGVYLSVNTNSFGKVNGTTSWNTNITNLADASHTIRVYAVSSIGRFSPTNEITITVSTSSAPDVENPTNTIASPTNTQTFASASVAVTGTAVDTGGAGLEGVYLSLDGGGFFRVTGASSWNTNLAGLSNGAHTALVFAVDNSTNYSITNSVSFFVRVPPSVTIAAPSNTMTIYSNDFIAGGSAADNGGTGLEGVYLSLDGGSFERVSGTVSWTTNLAGLTNGAHNIRVYTRDNSSTYSTTNLVNFSVSEDASPPGVAIVSPANMATVSNLPFTISGTASDTGLGIEGVYLDINGNGFNKVSGTDTWTSNVTGLSNGVYTISVYAKDNATNYSTTNQITISVEDYGPYAGLFTIVVANGQNIHISTNSYNNFFTIATPSTQAMVGASIDRHRNIYFSMTNTNSSIDTGSFGVIRDFSGPMQFNSWQSGNRPGICANDDYGYVYSYEVSGTADGGPMSTDYGTNYSWLDVPPLDQNGIGVTYVACNPSGYVVVGRANGQLSYRDGHSGSFSSEGTGASSYAQLLAITTNNPPTKTFVYYNSWQYLRTSSDNYAGEWDMFKPVSALYYHSQRLWVGYQDGDIAYSDTYGTFLHWPDGTGLGGTINTFAIDSQNRIFVGTDNGNLYISTDNATNFSLVQSFGSYITQIYVMDK